MAAARSLLLRALERHQLVHAVQVEQSAEAESATDTETAENVVSERPQLVRLSFDLERAVTDAQQVDLRALHRERQKEGR